MDEWLKQIQENMNEAAQGSAQWLSELSRQADQAVEKWVDDSLDTLQEIEQEIEQEVSRELGPTFAQFSDQVDSALDAGLVLFEQVRPWIENTTAPLVCTVNPWLQNHPTCVGCRNYHGTQYGDDDMLVCGMHPYGPDGDTCEDWESVWPTEDQFSSG